MRLALRAAGRDDLDLLVAFETDPEAARFVTCWPRARHAEALVRPDEQQLIVERDGRPVGFVLLRALGRDGGVVELARIVVSLRGQGLGPRALWLVLERAFVELRARRVWLDVMVDNRRARRAYEAVGFAEDGIAPRGPDEDEDHPLLVMSIDRERWEAGTVAA
jgi:RimJ/RimL family protein N-acetyltransferase